MNTKKQWIAPTVTVSLAKNAQGAAVPPYTDGFFSITDGTPLFS